MAWVWRDWEAKFSYMSEWRLDTCYKFKPCIGLTAGSKSIMTATVDAASVPVAPPGLKRARGSLQYGALLNAHECLIFTHFEHV